MATQYLQLLSSSPPPRGTHHAVRRLLTCSFAYVSLAAMLRSDSLHNSLRRFPDGLWMQLSCLMGNGSLWVGRRSVSLDSTISRAPLEVSISLAVDPSFMSLVFDTARFSPCTLHSLSSTRILPPRPSLIHSHLPSPRTFHLQPAQPPQPTFVAYPDPISLHNSISLTTTNHSPTPNPLQPSSPNNAILHNLPPRSPRPHVPRHPPPRRRRSC